MIDWQKEMEERKRIAHYAMDVESRRKMREVVDEENPKPYACAFYPVGAEDIDELFNRRFNRISRDNISMAVDGDIVRIWTGIEGRCDISMTLKILDAHDFYPGG